MLQTYINVMSISLARRNRLSHRPRHRICVHPFRSISFSLSIRPVQSLSLSVSLSLSAYICNSHLHALMQLSLACRNRLSHTCNSHLHATHTCTRSCNSASVSCKCMPKRSCNSQPGSAIAFFNCSFSISLFQSLSPNSLTNFFIELTWHTRPFSPAQYL